MNQVDIAKVRDEARRKWQREQKRQIPVLKKIEGSVQWWLVLIAAVFWLISAPHTAAIFDRLTPGWGWVAPVGVEFGLMYVALRRRQARENKHRLSVILVVLYVLLFLTAIIVNGAGSLMAVVGSAGVRDLSAQAIVDGISKFTILTQASLVLVPVAALIIPIGTATAGEGLAELIIEHKDEGHRGDEGWLAVKAHYEFEALRDAAIQAGDTPRHAAQWARAIAQSGLEGGLHTPFNSQKSEQTGQDTQHDSKTARELAMEQLAQNPALFGVSYRELERQTGIPKSAWEYAKKMKFPVEVERKDDPR